VSVFRERFVMITANDVQLWFISKCNALTLLELSSSRMSQNLGSLPKHHPFVKSRGRTSVQSFIWKSDQCEE